MIAVGSLMLEPDIMANDDRKSTQAARSAAEKEYHLLFSLKASYAKLIHVGGDRYQLLLPVSEVLPVLAFTDRPYRLAKRLSPDDFANLVHRGSHSFDISQPNVVVTFESEEPLARAYEMLGYQKDSNFVEYSLRYLGDSIEPPTPEEGSVTVFMDGFTGRLPS